MKSHYRFSPYTHTHTLSLSLSLYLTTRYFPIQSTLKGIDSTYAVVAMRLNSVPDESVLHSLITVMSSSSTRNTQTPGIPTLLVVSIFTMSLVCEPGTLAKRIPSPALNPTWASVPPKPLVPPEASPVVHWISPSA